MKQPINRRDFCVALSLAAAGRVGPVCAAGAAPVPPHLSGHAGLFARDPRAAALAWFREARFGLFVHWNVKANEEGKRHVRHFQADGFDAEAIVDVAAAAQMRHVTTHWEHHFGYPVPLVGELP